MKYEVIYHDGMSNSRVAEKRTFGAAKRYAEKHWPEITGWSGPHETGWVGYSESSWIAEPLRSDREISISR